MGTDRNPIQNSVLIRLICNTIHKGFLKLLKIFFVGRDSVESWNLSRQESKGSTGVSPHLEAQGKLPAPLGPAYRPRTYLPLRPSQGGDLESSPTSMLPSSEGPGVGSWAQSALGKRSELPQ